MKNRKETYRQKKHSIAKALNLLKKVAPNNDRARNHLNEIHASKEQRKLFDLYQASKYSQPPRPNQRKRRKLARQVPHGK